VPPFDAGGYMTVVQIKRRQDRASTQALVLDSFRVQRLGGENTMYRGFGGFSQRWMPSLFGVLAHMPGQQASRP
jgi:hypothetical protein